MDAGLRTLPGTAAEILDDEIRAIICPDKIDTEEWLEAHRTAHSIGLRSNITIMFGSVEQPVHWARHIVRTRDLQVETGGFTEFVPLPFVHMATPIYLQKKARRGPTFREVLLMHAVPRIAYHGLIDNIQTSWVKLGVGRRPPGAAGRRQRPRRHADGREHQPGRRRRPRPDDGGRRLPGPRRAARAHPRAAHHALRPAGRRLTCRPAGPGTAPATRRSTSCIVELVEEAGVHGDADLVFEMLVSALRMGRESVDRGDLKLVNAALKELRYSFLVFEPYRRVRKVSIFGSARTQVDDPGYIAARNFGRAMAEREWMIITGAGPGIMEAGIEGAGAGSAFGVNIVLPVRAGGHARCSPATRSSSTTATSSPASSAS